jgi:hypothetical protein
MKPATYNMPNHYKGDTFNAITFTIKEDAVAVDLTGAAIKMDFRKVSATGDPQQSMSIGSGITIVNDVGGIFKLDSFINNWAAQTYVYDAEITFADGSIKTYFKGSLKVEQDVANG